MDPSYLNVPAGQRRISPLTIENMEQQGATAHREPRSPDTTKGEVGSAADNVERKTFTNSNEEEGADSPMLLTPSSTKVETGSMINGKQNLADDDSAESPASSRMPPPPFALSALETLLLSDAPIQQAESTNDSPSDDQTIKTPADAKDDIRTGGLSNGPGEETALQDVTNKIEDLGLDQAEGDEGTDDRAATPKPTPAKTASTSAGSVALPASPDVDPFSPLNMVSSPLQGPTSLGSILNTRRTSNAGSVSVYGHATAARLPSLRRMSTADSMISGTSRIPLERENSNMMSSVTDVTVYSEATRIRFNEDDRRLEEFVNQNEPTSFVQQPAAEIPTEVDEKLKHGAYSFVCNFGWSGEEKSDLEETPLSRESYIEKLDDAKDGIRFVVRAIINYQNEINSRGHHKFTTQFLTHQNQACIGVLDQLDEIEEHLNDVIKEIQSFGEDDTELKAELESAYTHALPWVKRTQRLVSEAHIFYKLNYVLGRHQKTTKVKRALPTIPAGRPVPNVALERK